MNGTVRLTAFVIAALHGQQCFAQGKSADECWAEHKEQAAVIECLLKGAPPAPNKQPSSHRESRAGLPILLEACNAIQESDKRLECLKAAVGTARPNAPYDAVVRAFVGLRGNLESGISLNAYQAVLNELSRELAVFSREAGDDAKPAVAKLQEALDTYTDAATFWGAAIRFYARRDNGIAYGGGLPMQMVGLGWMISKHDLPTRKSDIWGINVGVPTDLGQSTMWAKANARAEEGIELLKRK